MIIDAEHDALGLALVEHLEGRTGTPLVLESDDGSSRVADMQPADFFASPEGWLWWERRALDRASGAVLDLGAGAGRHALHLQERGHSVTAVDASPGAVRVCRARGVLDVRHADLLELDLGPTDRWHTILLMGGNLGLAGNRAGTRRLLEDLGSVVDSGAVLIGDSVDPASDDPDDVAYEARNRAMGHDMGHVRLRLRHGDVVGVWWDQLNIPPQAIDDLVAGTGWSLVSTVGDDEGYAIVLERSAPARGA